MDDVANRLRSTRANMLGTDDEQHYMDCREAADLIDALLECYDGLTDGHGGGYHYCYVCDAIKRVDALLSNE